MACAMRTLRGMSEAERAFVGRAEAFDGVFSLRCFGSVRAFDLRAEPLRRMGSRITGALAGGMLGITLGHVHRDARVQAAVGAFDQVDEPGQVEVFPVGGRETMAIFSPKPQASAIDKK